MGVDESPGPERESGCWAAATRPNAGGEEETRHDVVKAQHRGGAPCRLPPALARPVQMPRAGHPHVRMQRDPALEPHQEMFAVWFDRLHPPSFESRDGRRPGLTDDLARDAPPQRGGGAPDRVPFRQGRAGARARAPRLSAWSRTQPRAASLRAETP